MIYKVFFLFLIVWSAVGQEQSFDEAQLLGKKNMALEGAEYQLLSEVIQAFEKMKKAALLVGIDIKVVSGFRSYERQRAIWNRKYKANRQAGLSPEENIQKIIEYSTLPGTSRHHWGTEIDIIDGTIESQGDVLLAEKFHEGGPYEPLHIWLEENAATFGFICAYPDQLQRTGFNYEPWHYSYAPLSRPLYRAYLDIDLKRVLTDSDLEGSNYLTKHFLDRYKTSHIMGIHPALK